MTHELLKIIKSYKIAKETKTKTVLATVVDLKGSSYRRPGVRMLITEKGTVTGAVSGGCVEKEIIRQTTHVFSTGKSVIMTYDGRYRLGCEGILYILLEPFEPSDRFLACFDDFLKNRKAFSLQIYYNLNLSEKGEGYTQFKFDESGIFPVAPIHFNPDLTNDKTFSQVFKPLLRLVIIGAEHDAVQLCSMASLMGWEVWVIASEQDPRTLLNFPGASKLVNTDATTFKASIIDQQTAVVLMTHSFVSDLKYLYKLKDVAPCYMGLLGPSARREKLLDHFIEQYPEEKTTFFDQIYGPAGLHLGAETPQEIAVSILAEMLSVVRRVLPVESLKNKKGPIHKDIRC
ncbi:XdhC family protein [Ascidiimonas sp. W6]|uniref:XdhC family protein n=1 Tax=Ascidiimonas meishanensis TaxID=3128903 RepID=UPI0030ED89E8